MERAAYTGTESRKQPQPSGQREKERLGIYIHIPFCVRKCAYCDFLSFPEEDVKISQYVDALKQEIREARELGSLYRAATVFFGGGTPSLLEGRQTAEILDEISRHITLEAEAEITVECNPGTLTKEKLSAYRAAGVNRLSLGLQSADESELLLLGRIHSYQDFLDSYELARRKGFENLNVDLMSALPGQTRESWLRTLERVADLGPEHISAYSLIIEEGTPFYERYRDGGARSKELPDENADRQMYKDTKRFLESRGYERYEISNYAKPGYACRHNLSYWERRDYKGFGIGAASLLHEVRYQNRADLEAWIRGDLSYESLLSLTRKDRLEETMFLGLRKTQGVILTEQIQKVYGGLLERLVKEGLLLQRENRIVLTDRGIDVSNYVLSEFLLDEEI